MFLEGKMIKEYRIHKNRNYGLYECINESKKNIEIKKKLDFSDILDVLLSNYYFTKNKCDMNTLRLEILCECKKFKLIISR